MTKKELRTSLSRIQPREDLVNDTIAQMRETKARSGRRFSPPRYSQVMRLAGTFCVLALVFCFGFAVAKQGPSLSKERTLADLSVVATTNNISPQLIDSQCENGYILINGNVTGLSFVELTETDRQNNAIRRCKTIISAEGLVEKSDELTVDLHRTMEEFEAEIVFYDDNTMNAFFNQSTQEMLLCLVPDQNGNWSIVDFAPFQK